MDDDLQKLRIELQAARQALAQAIARCSLQNAEHRPAFTEIEERCGALISKLMELTETHTKITKAHQEWESALDVLDDPIVMYDRDYRILRCNRAYQKIAEIPFDQIVGQTYYKIFPKTPVPPHHPLQSVENIEAKNNDEFVAGDTIYLSHTHPVNDDHGKNLYSVLVLENITARKISENKLSLFRTLLDHSSDAIEVIDPVSLRFVDMNETAHRGLGYTRDEFISMRIPDIDPTFKLLDHKAVEKKILQSGGAQFETLHLRKDGSTFPVEVNAKFIKLDGNYLLSIARDITDRRTAEETQKKLTRALTLLSNCNSALVHATNEQELLEEICKMTVETGGYMMAWVGFAENDSAKTVRPVAQSGYEEGYLEGATISWSDTKWGQGSTGTAIRTGVTVINQDCLNDPKMAPWREAVVHRGFQSNIALPLKCEERIVGALTIYSRESHAFIPEEASLLEKLADNLAYGIESLRAHNERDRATKKHLQDMETLRESLVATVKAIAGTVEAHDPYTAGHQSRVESLAVAIGREIGLPEESIIGLGLAASIHDLGKISVPAEILSRPGRLTNFELPLVKNHVQAGYDILKNIKFPWPIADMVRQHHERLDGSGYPQGLKGDQILLEARILAVADVVESMASHRPYRPSLGIGAALDEIDRNRGTCYDPKVVDACLRIFREEGFKLPG